MRQRELVEQPDQSSRKRPAPVPDLMTALGNRGLGQVLARRPDDRTTVEISGLGKLEIESFALEQAKHEVAMTCVAGELTPQLMEAAAKGKKFDTVTIVRPDGSTVTMTDVYVSSVQTGTTGSDRPVMSIRLSYAAIDFKAAAAAAP